MKGSSKIILSILLAAALCVSSVPSAFAEGEKAAEEEAAEENSTVQQGENFYECYGKLTDVRAVFDEGCFIIIAGTDGSIVITQKGDTIRDADMVGKMLESMADWHDIRQIVYDVYGRPMLALTENGDLLSSELILKTLNYKLNIPDSAMHGIASICGNKDEIMLFCEDGSARTVLLRDDMHDCVIHDMFEETSNVRSYFNGFDMLIWNDGDRNTYAAFPGTNISSDDIVAGLQGEELDRIWYSFNGFDSVLIARRSDGTTVSVTGNGAVKEKVDEITGIREVLSDGTFYIVILCDDGTVKTISMYDDYPKFKSPMPDTSAILNAEKLFGYYSYPIVVDPEGNICEYTVYDNRRGESKTDEYLRSFDTHGYAVNQVFIADYTLIGSDSGKLYEPLIFAVTEDGHIIQVDVTHTPIE